MKEVETDALVDMDLGRYPTSRTTMMMVPLCPGKDKCRPNTTTNMHVDEDTGEMFETSPCKWHMCMFCLRNPEHKDHYRPREE